MSDPTPQPQTPEKERSFFGIIIHSFFIIPFLIAVFCVLLFAAVRLLTHEQKTAYDLLNDVKTGGVTKRWQGAFELSKILSNPKMVPQEERFQNELISAFKNSKTDEPLVRQYLAFAMGRTGNPVYFEPLTADIQDEREENVPAILYALGMIKDLRGIPIITGYTDHPSAKIRSIAVVALGNTGDHSIKKILKKTLNDAEPNVQWGSAISLAQMGDSQGKGILFQLLDRRYLSQFPEVDSYEQNHLILNTISAAANLNDPELNNRISELSKLDQNSNVRAAAMKFTENLKK